MKQDAHERKLVMTAIILLALFLGLLSNCIGQPADCMEQKALRLTGIREQGVNDGEFVNRVLSWCGLENTQAAWCGGMNYVAHLECGLRKTDLPDAPCWSPAWARTDKLVWRQGQPHDAIQKGMSVLLWSETKKRIAHVGWVVYKSEDRRGWYVVYCSGNMRDPDNKWNPGDGVHMLKLYLTQIHCIADWISKPDAPVAKYHVVRPKETLYRLSVMYGVSVDDLRKWNHISDNGIFVGQELKVSA